MRQKNYVQKRASLQKVYYSTKVMEFWHSGTELQWLQNIKKLRVGILLTPLNILKIFTA